ncbi:hypothetical protein HELRODRAFT_97190 [Helobdella robusta]|uniref:MI domain-containing protein n=1 Tax=Helobdella robusta TaxID=6412 RepID=T1G9F8_HELRO|nr:hypothetical protein HELRODRAFT_97190 [Helobdella robusta]ESO11029.1 hypothetical protein HELRODRAFT_97190 [Helobdella robusta]
MNRGYSAKKGQEGNRQNQAKRQLSNDQVQRKVIEFRLQNDITLHTAENAWKPKKEASSETEVVYKKIRAILNKLTPQKFQTLIEQVRHLPINTEERLKGCINIIFEKAVSEPNFAIAYANMAKCLFGMNVPLDSKPEETVSFRKLLLTKCQIEFEKDKEEEEVIAVIQSKIDDATLSEDDKKKLIEEKNDAMWKAKKRSLGNIKFIGELFKLKMLTEKIMHECLTKLFKFTEDEDSLECLCQLMSTIGKDIDQGPSKIHMDAYFDRMKNFVNMKKSSQRIRFMMLDVIDLRKSGWVPRRENNPKTIDQIHQEAKQEEEERQQKAAMFDQAQRKKQAEHRFNQPNMMSQSSNNIKEDGWTNVSRPPKATPLDMSKIKLTRTNVDDNIQLGPGGRGGWGRGSMGGAALKAAAPPEPEKPLLNRFSLLSNSIDSTTDSSRSGASLQLPSRDSYKGRSSGPQNQSKVQTLGRSSHEKPSYQLSEERPKSPQQQPMIPFQHSHSLRPQQPITESLMMTTTPLTMTTTTKTSASVLSSEELERKAQNIIDEYLHLNDVKEALECIADLNVKENELNARRFFYKSMEYTVERSSQVRNQIGTLHRHLLKKNLVQSPLCYTAALTRLSHFALDAVIDIPQIWEYIGEIVCPLFLESHDIPLNFLVAPFARIKEEEDFEYCGADVEDNRARLMAVVVDALSKHLGHHAASDLWKKSKLKWEDLVKCTPVTEFVRKFVSGLPIEP